MQSLVDLIMSVSIMFISPGASTAGPTHYLVGSGLCGLSRTLSFASTPRAPPKAEHVCDSTWEMSLINEIQEREKASSRVKYLYLGVNDVTRVSRRHTCREYSRETEGLNELCMGSRMGSRNKADGLDGFFSRA